MSQLHAMATMQSKPHGTGEGAACVSRVCHPNSPRLTPPVPCCRRCDWGFDGAAVAWNCVQGSSLVGMIIYIAWFNCTQVGVPAWCRPQNRPARATLQTNWGA